MATTLVINNEAPTAQTPGKIQQVEPQILVSDTPMVQIIEPFLDPQVWKIIAAGLFVEILGCHFAYILVGSR